LRVAAAAMAGSAAIGRAAMPARTARRFVVFTFLACDMESSSVFGLEPSGKLQLPLGSHVWYHSFVKKQPVQPRKKRGPAPTGKGTPIQVRAQPDMLGALDAWIARQDDRPSR